MSSAGSRPALDNSPLPCGLWHTNRVTHRAGRNRPTLGYDIASSMAVNLTPLSSLRTGPTAPKRACCADRPHIMPRRIGFVNRVDHGKEE